RVRMDGNGVVGDDEGALHAVAVHVGDVVGNSGELIDGRLDGFSEVVELPGRHLADVAVGVDEPSADALSSHFALPAPITLGNNRLLQYAGMSRYGKAGLRSRQAAAKLLHRQLPGLPRVEEPALRELPSIHRPITGRRLQLHALDAEHGRGPVGVLFYEGVQARTVSDVHLEPPVGNRRKAAARLVKHGPAFAALPGIPDAPDGLRPVYLGHHLPPAQAEAGVCDEALVQV